MKALIIDDEILAREELIDMLEAASELDIVGQAGNAIEGLQLIHKLKPDVVFLDIEMPKVTGLEMVSMLDPHNMPHIIFVTAFDQYAIQAFEEQALDYLLKPVEPCRLNKALAKLDKQQDITKLAIPSLGHIPCVGHQRIMLIPMRDIEYVESDHIGIHVQTAEQRATSQLSLKQLEEKTDLFRCHRQFLVNLPAIAELRFIDNGLAELVTHSQQRIPVSRRFLKPVKEALGIV
jgi:two-component system LytT family response regulator